MSTDLVASIVSGLLSGALGGAATSSLYIRLSSSTVAKSGSQAASGSRAALASGGGLAASGKGPITQSLTNVERERRAQLSAVVTRSSAPGLPKQVLRIRNVGEAAAENLVVGPAPGGGAFTAQPNWAAAPKRIAGGESVDLACVTSGSGLVSFIASFTDRSEEIGPQLIEATHG